MLTHDQILQLRTYSRASIPKMVYRFENRAKMMLQPQALLAARVVDLENANTTVFERKRDRRKQI